MARRMSSDRTEIFRAVVTVTNDLNPEGYERHYGPFQTKGAAAAAITRESRVSPWHSNPYNTKVSGKVQRAKAKWEDVG